MAKKDELVFGGGVVSSKEAGLTEREKELRKKIRERAQELLTQGMSQGAAAQQAYSEIWPKEPTKFEQAKQEALAESPAAVQKLQDTRAAYVDQRAGELELAGFQPEESRSKAEKEFEESFTKPVKSPYGDLGERGLGGVFGLIEPAKPTSISPKVSGAEATLGEALRPQTFLPESEVKKEEKRMARPSQIGIIGQGPDFEAIQRDLEKEIGAKDADIQLRGIRKAYERNLVGATKSPSEVWQDTISEIQRIPKIIADEQNYVKPEIQRGGPADPLYLAFSKQVKEGKGVPKLSEAQGLFLASVAQDTRADVESKLKEEYATKPLIKTETEAVEGIRGAAPRKFTRELAGAEKDAEISRMAAEQVETPWWTDPKKVEQRLANPERYTKPGVFQSETPFGTQVESNVGYITRAAMAPLNVVAGALFPVLMTGTGETKEAVEEARRRVRPEAYKDSPILLNIAEGRGFVGEASELAQLTGLNEEKLLGPISVGNLYTAGAFAADLLDPTLDVLYAGSAGLRFGRELAKTGAKLGVKAPSVKGGISEGLKTFVTENPATNLIAKRVGVAPGDIRLSISDAVAKQASGDLFDAQGARVAVPDNAPKPVKDIGRKLDSLDQLVAPDVAKRGEVLSTKEFTDALVEASVRNPDVATIIRDVESSLPFKRPSLLNPARIKAVADNPQVYKEVQDALIRQSARNIVFKETGNTVLRNGIVAVTKNTFATQDQATKILKDYSSTPFMKEVVPEIVKNPGTAASRVSAERGVKVVDGYRIDRNAPAGVETVGKIIDEAISLVNDGKMSKSYFDRMVTGLTGGDGSISFISSDDLRFLIDSGIDKVANKYRIATSKEILEVSPVVAKQISEPLSVRDFSNPRLRQFVADVRGKVPTEVLTPAQKAVYEPVAAGLGKMDVKLRNDMQKMISSPEFRAAYGIPADAKLSRQELLGYLIVGATKDIPDYLKSMELPRIQNILKNAIDNSIYAKNTQIDIFDMFSGVSTQNVTDVWSSVGRQKIDDLVKSATEVVYQNPSKYAEEMAKLREEAIKLSRDPANIKIDPKEVIVGEAKIPERLVASYYFAQSSRLINDALDDIIRVGGISFKNTFDNMTTPLRRAVVDTENLGIYVRNYIDASLLDPAFRQKSLQDIAKEIAGDNPEIIKNASEFVGEVSYLADNIMKNNRIFAPEDLSADLEKIIQDASIPDSSVRQNLDAFLGTNVAGQVRKALEEGGGKKIQKALAEALTTSNDPKVAQFANKVLDGLNNAWYTLTLTAAPRFHGANIVGAPEVIYTTTGKLISPLPIPGTSTFDAALVMKRANGPKGGMTAVIDPAGRRYTNNEIYQAVMESGGETVNKAELSSIDSRRALIQLQEGNTGKARRAIDYVMESPNTEDAIYRTAVAIEALREGQPMEQALQLARKSLYDKGDISKYEQQAKRAIMFYSFTRNNFVNLLKNMTDIRGWNRLANVAKTKRGVESIFLTGMTEDEKRYLPDTAATRIVLGKGNPYGEKGNIIVSPASSTYSAIELLTKGLAGDQQVFIDLFKPRQVGALEGPELDKIPAEHVFYIKGLAEISGADETEVMSWLTGEKMIPLRSDDADNIEGYIYPLTTKSAKDRYKATMLALKLIGINRIISDYAASARAPGTKTAAALTPLETAGFAAGAISPIRTLSAEQQRLSALLAQTKEGKALLKDVKDALQNDALLKAPEAPQKLKEAAEKIKAGKQRKADVKENLDDITKEIIRLDAEIKQLDREIRQNPTLRDINVPKIKENAARIKELNKRKKDIKQSKQQ